LGERHVITPLINTSHIDSLALFKLAMWIEKETNAELDLMTVYPSKEWDTIADILDLLGNHRTLKAAKRIYAK